MQQKIKTLWGEGRTERKVSSQLTKTNISNVLLFMISLCFSGKFSLLNLNKHQKTYAKNLIEAWVKVLASPARHLVLKTGVETVGGDKGGTKN